MRRGSMRSVKLALSVLVVMVSDTRHGRRAGRAAELRVGVDEQLETDKHSVSAGRPDEGCDCWGDLP